MSDDDDLKKVQATIDTIRAAAGYTPLSPDEVRRQQVMYPASVDRAAAPPPFIDPDTGLPTNFKPLSDEERAARDEEARRIGREFADQTDAHLLEELRGTQANIRYLREMCAPRGNPPPSRPTLTVIEGGI